MLDFADVIALNKFDKRGAQDALRDVRKQYQRNHKLFEEAVETMPVLGTIASQFNDPGMNTLYSLLMNKLAERTGAALQTEFTAGNEMSEKIFIIPPKRTRYLSEIAETVRNYNEKSEEQAEIAQKMYQLKGSIELLNE